MAKMILIEAAKCVGCKTCEMVCSLSHTDEVNPMRSRIRVSKWEEEGHNLPLNCRHCEATPCLEICPRQAIERTEEPYGVLIDPERCIGCQACLLVCPFGAISFDAIEKKVVKCDLCQGDPWCVRFCTYGALSYVEAEELNAGRQTEAAETLHRLGLIVPLKSG